MALDVGELVARARIDNREFEKGLSDGERRFREFGDNLKNTAKLVGAAIAVALAVGMTDAIKKASDLAETTSKIQQIFGANSQAVLDFAATADKALGQSKQAALDGAATFAIFGKSAGLAGNDLVSFSTDMVKLASDLASFHNTSPEDAILAIGAALRGESEPIRAYGILLDEDTLRLEALRLGIVKTTKEALTPQQRVLAAQSAIMKQAGDATGDFARTSNGLANQQRILTARMDNLKAEMGTKLLPIMLKIVGIASQMIDYWQANSQWLGPLIGVIAGVAGSLWLLVTVVKAYTAVQWALNAALTANPIGLVIVAIVALIAGLVLLYKNSETFRKIVDATWRGIKTAVMATVDWLVGTAWPWIKRVWEGIAAGATWLWQNVLQPVISFIVGAFQWWMNIVKSTGALFLWLYQQAIAPVVALIKFQIQVLGAVFTWLYDNAIKPAFDAIAKAFTWIWRNVTEPAFNAIMGIVRKVGDVFKSVFGAIAGFVSDAFSRAVGFVRNNMNAIIRIINRAVDFINSNVIDNANKVPGVSYDHLGHIPALARGGAVHPTPGGRPVIMGDGGEVEYGIPRSDMRAIIAEAVRAGRGGGDGATLTVVLDGRGVLRGIREVVRIEGEDTTVLVGA